MYEVGETVKHDMTSGEEREFEVVSSGRTQGPGGPLRYFVTFQEKTPKPKPDAFVPGFYEDMRAMSVIGERKVRWFTTKPSNTIDWKRVDVTPAGTTHEPPF